MILEDNGPWTDLVPALRRQGSQGRTERDAVGRQTELRSDCRPQGEVYDAPSQRVTSEARNQPRTGRRPILSGPLSAIHGLRGTYVSCMSRANLFRVLTGHMVHTLFRTHAPNDAARRFGT